MIGLNLLWHAKIVSSRQTQVLTAVRTTQNATRIVYWLLWPVNKRTARENYILCLYSGNICIVRTALPLPHSLLVGPLQQNLGST
jgi:hypothetical protein